jgi:phosphatidylserine/phosphatidylglycerophosphate/cardiolipin synthase-like enzyme
MHAKVILADEQEAIVSTGNYSLWQLQQERNFGARLSDPLDLATLSALFDADWDRQSPDLSCTRLLIAPLNARDRLLSLIDSAQKTLDIESMQFADTDVRNRVAARKRAGVNVRVILADPGWIDTNKDAAAFLSAHGIPARYLVSPSVHVKAMVVDGTRAFLGSENLSWTSLTKNREVGLIDTEPGNVQGMSATFAQDWAAGKTF